MAANFDLGTPIGGERKTRRFRSPLQEMDGIVTALDFASDFEEQPVPSTPKDAEPVTMAGIVALLSSALTPLSTAMNEVKAEVANLRGQVEENESTSEARFEGIKFEFGLLRTDVSRCNGKHQTLELKVGKLEEIIEELSKNSSTSVPRSSTEADATDTELTAVLGGLSFLPGEAEASQWLEDKLWEAYGPTPIRMYTKGDFKGMLFARFGSKEDRDTAVSVIRSLARSHDKLEVWAKPDRVLAQRTVHSIVFGTKY